MNFIAKTIVVGMSGGVDSSVAALLLKKQGHNVIGLFMKNWEEEDENGVCQASKEYEDVIKVCEKIGISYYSVEFVDEYRENVFNHFVEDYKQGFTPNPDILCNREIKFKVFFNKAMELGADYLATGHYCQTKEVDGVQRLVKGLDPGKDQSYFLQAVKGEILKKVLFPIGHLLKSDVRKIALDEGLATSEKKDSTGICFIGERNFKNFLSQYITFKEGEFQNLDGTIVGKHSGSSFYTLGQRKGLGLGGPGEPWFVVDKNTEKNIVFVERGFEHPRLYCDELWADQLDLVSPDLELKLPLECKAKVRYRQEDQECKIVSISEGIIHVTFSESQRAVTPSQSIAFYQTLNNEEVCLGGARIIKPGLSHFEKALLP